MNTFTFADNSQNNTSSESDQIEKWSIIVGSTLGGCLVLTIIFIYVIFRMKRGKWLNNAEKMESESMAKSLELQDVNIETNDITTNNILRTLFECIEAEDRTSFIASLPPDPTTILAIIETWSRDNEPDEHRCWLMNELGVLILQSDYPDGPKANILMICWNYALRFDEEGSVNWAFTCNNLGVAHMLLQINREQNVEKAILWLQKALTVRNEKDFPFDRAVTLFTLSKAYNERILGEKSRNWQEAIMHAREALRIIKEYNDSSAEALSNDIQSHIDILLSSEDEFV